MHEDIPLLNKHSILNMILKSFKAHNMKLQSNIHYKLKISDIILVKEMILKLEKYIFPVWIQTQPNFQDEAIKKFNKLLNNWKMVAKTFKN